MEIIEAILLLVLYFVPTILGQEAACERCPVHLLRESRFRLDRCGLDIGADVGDNRTVSTSAGL
jgi:hypothetical protein